MKRLAKFRLATMLVIMTPVDEQRVLETMKKAGVTYRLGPSGRAVSVSMEDAQISDALMAQIGRLAALESLVLTNCEFRNEALKYVGGLSKLKGLRLRGSSVDDAGLEHFSGLQELIALDLQETKVTRSALEELAKQLPNCSIIADSFRTDGR